MIIDASEISQVFDKITYCKGASVIYMLHQFIGPENFKMGIREYIQAFSYGNAGKKLINMYIMINRYRQSSTYNVF